MHIFFIFLVSFGTKRALFWKSRRTCVCHVVCFHSFSMYKKVPRFQSILFVGTVLSPPAQITRPLCSDVSLVFYSSSMKNRQVLLVLLVEKLLLKIPSKIQIVQRLMLKTFWMRWTISFFSSYGIFLTFSHFYELD